MLKSNHRKVFSDFFKPKWRVSGMYFSPFTFLWKSFSREDGPWFRFSRWDSFSLFNEDVHPVAVAPSAESQEWTRQTWARKTTNLVSRLQKKEGGWPGWWAFRRFRSTIRRPIRSPWSFPFPGWNCGFEELQIKSCIFRWTESIEALREVEELLQDVNDFEAVAAVVDDATGWIRFDNAERRHLDIKPSPSFYSQVSATGSSFRTLAIAKNVSTAHSHLVLTIRRRNFSNFPLNLISDP